MLKALVVLTSVVVNVLTFELYGNNNSNVINLNRKNFETQITSNRAKKVVSIVHYYKPNDGKSELYKKEFETLSTEYDGMFKVTAMNCQDSKDICEKQGIKEYPTLKVYPPLPAPIFDYEGKVEVGSIVSYLGKFVDNTTVELNNNNIDSFTNGNPNLPKAILFTDKKGVPLIYKTLAIAFEVSELLII
jgi:thioredoxin-like negative regulator of GroEL